jgi:Icc-related predicted phosphoesterase
MDALLNRKEPSAWETFLKTPLLFLGTKLYHFTHLHSLHSAKNLNQKHHGRIRVVCISDTHNNHDSTSPLPNGDILIHAGDLTHSGTKDELFDALSWLHDQPHPIKLFVAGNHDWALTDTELVQDIRTRYPSLTYLQDSKTCINVRGRELTVYGSPQTPKYGSWPFQYPRIHNSSLHSEKLSSPWTDVPPHTDILITHGPPEHHLDNNGLGCAALLQTLWRIKPRLHVFGHIHAARGVERVSWDTSQKAYENLCRERGGCYNFLTLLVVLLTRLWQRTDVFSTTLVNASVVGGFRDELRRGAIVVDIE